jgi:RNA polymerase sigma-70 factor (ECF subfamily)
MVEHAPLGTEALRLHLLVLRCQAGDEQAFAHLFREFSQRTLTYLGGLLGDAADDIQQEVWLAVYRGIRTLSNPGAFRTWLFRTTRHRAIDFLRRQKREQELIFDAAQEVAVTGEVVDESARDLDDAALTAALAVLPAAQREVLLLRYRDDLSYTEIAQVVGCSIGTVRSRLHHAKQRVLESIEHENAPRGATSMYNE